MTFADLFSHYWWLIFPIFGMAMGWGGMVSNERRARSMMEVLKSYVDQGKEPPPELMRFVSMKYDEFGDLESPSDRASGRIWSFIIFAAIAAGMAVAYAFNRSEDWAWVFLTVCVVMAVMAVGALGLLIFNRKS
jgi:Flp pilus assembly protein TadB